MIEYTQFPNLKNNKLSLDEAKQIIQGATEFVMCANDSILLKSSNDFILMSGSTQEINELHALAKKQFNL